MSNQQPGSDRTFRPDDRGLAIRNEKYFAELDGVCGDGDFGISLAAGFTKVMEQWDNLDRSTPGALLKGGVDDHCQQGRRCLGRDLGHGVPARQHCRGDQGRTDAEDVIAMFTAATEGMKKRGQSDLGDKTLLDAFVPAWEEFAKVVRAGGSSADAIAAASVVARQKTEEIKPWVAKRGRASYTGERSCDTYDAGSVAIAMMAEELAKVWTRSSTVAERGV